MSTATETNGTTGPAAPAPSDPAVLVLRGPESLRRLRDPNTKRVVRRIVVADPRLDGADATRLEQQLNRWYFACGCEQGSAAVLLTLMVSVWGGIANDFDGPFVWWRVLVYAMVAALVGKAAGLAVARLRLRALLRRLEVSISDGDGTT